MTTPPAVPFPGASWNALADDLGPAPASLQPLAEKFRLHAGGAAPPGSLSLSFADYAVTIIDAANPLWAPNTSVRVYQSCWARDPGYGFLDGIALGQTIPWNFAWRPGTGNDRIMIIENFPLARADGTVERVTAEWWDVYDMLYNAWDVPWASNSQTGVNWSNNAHGFSDTWPYNAWTSPTDPGNRKIVTGGAVITRGTWAPGWRTRIDRGMGIDKRALVATAAEAAYAVASGGTIPHALEATICNTMWTEKYPGLPGRDFVAPATRCEWLTSNYAWRNGVQTDPDITHMLPHGLRPRLRPDICTDRWLENWATSRGLSGSTRALALAFGRTLRDRGIVVAETGGWGCSIETTGIFGPDRALWGSLGVSIAAPKANAMHPQANLLDGLIQPGNLEIVRPA